MTMTAPMMMAPATRMTAMVHAGTESEAAADREAGLLGGVALGVDPFSITLAVRTTLANGSLGSRESLMAVVKAVSRVMPSLARTLLAMTCSKAVRVMPAGVAITISSTEAWVGSTCIPAISGELTELVDVDEEDEVVVGSATPVTATAVTWFAGTPGNACTSAEITAAMKVCVTSVGEAPCRVRENRICADGSVSVATASAIVTKHVYQVFKQKRDQGEGVDGPWRKALLSRSLTDNKASYAPHMGASQ
jgi:hypothetical protein